MCGLAGFYNPHKREIQFTEAEQKKLDHLLLHRGPDAGGIHLEPDNLLCFSHRRLSIVELTEAAAQPMWNEAKTSLIIYNGEIYNNRELQNDLKSEGVIFRSHSDTETLLYLIDRWGIEGLHRINGMFSFAFFDMVQQKLLLVRDRFGIKPLYFNYQNEIWSFASEIKAFHAFPWVSFDINPHAVDHYLTFMTTPSPLTLYKNTYKLPAGHLLEIDKSGTASVKEWYSPLRAASQYPSSLYTDEETCIETTRFLLKESIKEHMHSDLPVGAFLSGGLDSSLNVALMSEHSSKIKTFTVAMDNNDENELAWARKVADKFGTDHHEIIITDEEAANFYEKMIEQVDEPVADSVNIPFYFVAQKAKEAGISVAQVGEAADELFFGYPMYERYAKLLSFEKATKKIPQSLKEWGASLIQSAFPYHANYTELARSWAEDNPLFLSGAVSFHPLAKERFLPSYDLYYDDLLLSLFPQFPYTQSSSEITRYHLDRLHHAIPDADPTQIIMFLELSQRLPDLLLMRANKMSMLTSLEARVPFLDHRLVEYLFFMPERFKTNGYQRKYLLKKVAQGLIPDEIIHRKKVGFAAPVKTWMKQGSLFNASIDQMAHSRPSYYTRYASYKKLPMTVSPALQAVQDWTIQNLLTTLHKNQNGKIQK
ncbi:asparagine synthase (glutamine-hydrolyzing) [Candidatus Babeliales bacterium]|nr:asparagine synthase (glutamine-hydrolyzing) [Candidatus Babeliales bacterium]